MLDSGHELNTEGYSLLLVWGEALAASSSQMHCFLA